MAAGIQLEGFDRVLSQLKAKSLTGRKELEIEVGYECPYAVVVHENPVAHHPIGNWKFLEGPARRGRGQMGKIIKGILTQKRSLEKALLAATEWLKTASQAETPYKTGQLRGSWFQNLK